MKKFLIFIITVMLSILSLTMITACGEEDDQPIDVTGTYTFVSQTTTFTSIVGESKLEVGDYYPNTNLKISENYIVLAILDNGTCTLTVTDPSLTGGKVVQKGVWSQSENFVTCVIVNSTLGSSNLAFKVNENTLTLTLDFEGHSTKYVLSK